MLQLINKKRGQSTLEYAVLIVIIIGALLTIQVYFKRAVQGKVKSSADDIGDQYSDGNQNVIKTTVRVSNEQELDNQGQTSTVLNNPETTNTTMNSVIINTQQEYWGG